jgi:hypothetical protein
LPTSAADCTYASYYKSTSAVRTQIINDWNQASAVYERSFNVSLGLINITVMDTTCPTTPASSTAWNRACSSTYAISDRLSDFSQWRGSLGNDGAGLWHLMTQCKYVHAKTLIHFDTYFPIVYSTTVIFLKAPVRRWVLPGSSNFVSIKPLSKPRVAHRNMSLERASPPSVSYISSPFFVPL